MFTHHQQSPTLTGVTTLIMTKHHDAHPCVFPIAKTRTMPSRMLRMLTNLYHKLPHP
jgi:hypothetical protein